jgi:DNA repair photolyase
MIHEIQVKSALHYHKREFATHWDLNCYRGCGHHCIYCFAQYSHKYLESEDFFDDIWVKTNITQALEKDFSKKNWCGACVNVCGVTDGYQPIEQKFQLMPSIIRCFTKYRNPLAITTKSHLIVRDLPLLTQLNKVAYVVLRMSISTTDENLREKLEPYASKIQDRFEALKLFAAAGIDTGILLMPIMPYINDSFENLENIFREARSCGVKEVIVDILHLRGHTRQNFLSHVQKLFPQHTNRIHSLYKESYADKTYSKALYQKIVSLRSKYKFNTPRPSTVHMTRCSKQLELFSHPINLP